MRENLQIRIVRKNGNPIASILTLRHQQVVVYKYGASDERFHHLAGMPFLLWRFIEESKEQGACEIDFGRSDLGNKGLIAFKDRFGCRKRCLTYFRYSPSSRRNQHPFGAALLGDEVRKGIVRFVPDVVLKGMGQALYRHLG